MIINIKISSLAFRISFVFLVVQLMQGCAAIRPFPMAARSGDTITLAVGSLDGANEDNLTISFTAADSAVVDLTPKESLIN